MVNGLAVDSASTVADGRLRDVRFSYPIARSSGVALRIYPGAHTNPIFVEVGGKAIRERKSIEWCRKSVDRCWKTKEKNIRPAERAAAQAAYDQARAVYDQRLAEAAAN